MSGLLQLLGLGARSLTAAQLAQATVGNNAANAATPGFSRRRVALVEAPTVQRSGGVVGTGVLVEEIVRLRDRLADAQWRADSATLAHAQARAGLFAQIEPLFAPGEEAGLATALTAFFAAFGDLAARPEDPATRQALIGRGQTLAAALQRTRQRLLELEADTHAALAARVAEVNDVATRLAAVNARVAGGGAGDPALADEQDRLVDRLAELLGVRATVRSDGTVQVVVDGTGVQLVDGDRAATLTLTGSPTLGAVSLDVGGVALATAGGEIGGLLATRNSTNDGLPRVLAELDTFAAGLIEAVNRVHASGAGRTLAQAATGSVQVADPTVPLAAAGLWVTPQSGTLTLGASTAAGTIVSSSSVAVDPATMSLDDLAAAIDALPDLSASVVGGRLLVSATDPANRVVFGPDTSDVLVALGLNGFFTGTDAGSIAVAPELVADPSRIAAAQADFATGVVSPGDNRNARALQALQASASFGGGSQTASEFLGTLGATVGSWAQAAEVTVETARALVAAAQAQRQRVAGVSVDEELADMLRYQHAWDAAARYLRTVDEMVRALLQTV